MVRQLKRASVFVFAVLALAILVSTVPALAQPGGGGNPCPGGQPCNPHVPITGIEYLIGGGALFGIRTLLKRMKQKGD
jgi:hypothetical protein